MPGLILFRRRWAIGSDDFVFTSLGDALLRIAWQVALIVIYCVHQHGFSCEYGSQLRSFYIGTLVLNSLGIILALTLLKISMQGTIRDNWPRRNVPKCLYAKLLLTLLEAVWVCLSTYWAFGHVYSCDWSIVWTARGAVICSWIVGFIMFISFLVIFDPIGNAHNRSSYRYSFRGNSTMEPASSITDISSISVWETRCQLMCCCVAWSPDTRQALRDVGKIVADFFNDVDLVPTDVAAGLVVVQQQQLCTENQLTTVVTLNTPSPAPNVQFASEDSMPMPKEWMTISNMAHFMKFALGSYGWPFYIYDNMALGICRLCSSCRPCACIRKPNGVIGDNICNCNTAAIKKLSGVSSDDLIYVSFHNKFKEVPFYVVVDRSTHSVVISIRGTLSFEDALADLSATGADLDIPGVRDSYCHAAMLDCAKYIQEKLESLRVLDTAFAQLEPGAGLVVTGHSLGAGVAAILAVLLRPDYPEVMCFSYSPPGGLMSPSASRYTQDFVCSVVVGKDLIPRLGMYTLIDLKVKVLRALCHCNIPKYRILATGCLSLFCGLSSSISDLSDMSHSITDRRSENERIPVLQDTLKLAESQLKHVVSSPWPLHPAGQILHVVEVSQNQNPCGYRPQYAAFWSRAEFFHHIVISPKMVSDHIPNVVYLALDQLKNQDCIPQFRQTVQQQQC